MPSKGRRILVTGIAGFLGSNLLQRLLDEGWTIVGIDNLSMGTLENVQEFLRRRSFRFVKADVTDPRTFERLPRGFDAVVHLAAFKIPRYGKAIDTLRINYHGTENVLEFAKREGCKCVLASTSDVYGKNPNIPFSELSTDSVIGPSTTSRWGYAVSKLMDEHIALAYQDAYGFPVTLLRFFGSYGPKQHLSWWGGPQSVFIDAVLRDRVLPIHGDGKQTRSFTYVTDTVDGIYASIVKEAANGQILNIGGAEEVTIVELAELIHRLCGARKDLRLEFTPYESFTGAQYEDVRRRVPDTSRSERLLGVSAKVGLEEGLLRTIDWQRSKMASELEVLG